MAGRRKNILDVYRELKKREPDFVLAFGDEQFFTFYMADAHRVHDALPDIRIEHERVDFIRIHKLLFQQLVSRHRITKVAVASVARTKKPDGTYSYRVADRYDLADRSGDSPA